MATKKTDSFANVAAIKVTESAINTLTSAKFAFPFSIMDKMALVIGRIEYWLATVTRMDASTDSVQAALTASSAISDISAQNDPLIIDTVSWARADLGVAASGLIIQNPVIKDFSSLAGGGLLVAPSPLYATVAGGGCTAVNSLWLKLFYTYVELNTDEYWQLVESRRIISG